MIGIHHHQYFTLLQSKSRSILSWSITYNSLSSSMSSYTTHTQFTLFVIEIGVIETRTRRVQSLA